MSTDHARGGPARSPTNSTLATGRGTISNACLVDLVIEGILLSVDGGYFTLHGYGYSGPIAPVPTTA